MNHDGQVVLPADEDAYPLRAAFWGSTKLVARICANLITPQTRNTFRAIQVESIGPSLEVGKPWKNKTHGAWTRATSRRGLTQKTLLFRKMAKRTRDRS